MLTRSSCSTRLRNSQPKRSAFLALSTLQVQAFTGSHQCLPRHRLLQHSMRLSKKQASGLKCSAAAGVDSAAASGIVEPQQKRIGVLFVCLGNICRSPTAEAVFRAVVERAGLQHAFDIDSCGTGGGNPDWFRQGGWSYHQGDPADPRMTAAAKRRGVKLTSLSRPLQPKDFACFQYMIAMDNDNVQAITEASEYWASAPADFSAPLKRPAKEVAVASRGEGMAAALPLLADQSQVSLMMSYCRTNKFKGQTAVPDPYFGGPQGFDRVLDLLDDACTGLLEELRVKHGL